ncbi:MAG: helix-turn-helix domain-containing protein [Paracoccaceae bacterium]
MDDFSDRAATFGDRLALAREAQGISQAQLARHLGIEIETVAGWEAARAEPRANRLQMLAGLLNVSIVWLLTGAGDGAPGADAGLIADHGDMRALVGEMRALRTKQARIAEDLGRLEKRLMTLAGA